MAVVDPRHARPMGETNEPARLLVGTVFIDASPVQQQWFDLQLRFLARTTGPLDHVTFMSDGSNPEVFSGRSKILRSDQSALTSHVAHVYGLERLLAYFRSHADEYDYFLFLDFGRLSGALTLARYPRRAHACWPALRNCCGAAARKP